MPKTPDLYIMKLGGSVITTKGENEFRVKRGVLARIALEIKRAVEENGFSLIVVHGAGPFGHANVKQCGIGEGVFTERQRRGLTKTIHDCNFLNSVVVEKLREASVEALAFDPNKIVVQEEKKIVRFETRGIEKALKEGKVPVLFGQMVPDRKLNASVLSGDTITAFLAKRLKPKKVLLGTDVSGVFTADPKSNPKAKRIELIDRKNFEEVLKKVGGTAAVDVTQGMRGKLLRLKEHLKNKNVLIFNAVEPGSVYRALAGKRVGGTTMRL